MTRYGRPGRGSPSWLTRLMPIQTSSSSASSTGAGPSVASSCFSRTSATTRRAWRRATRRCARTAISSSARSASRDGGRELAPASSAYASSTTRRAAASPRSRPRRASASISCRLRRSDAGATSCGHTSTTSSSPKSRTRHCRLVAMRRTGSRWLPPESLRLFEDLFQRLVDEPRVRATARLLHHLADEEAHEARLAAAQLGRLPGVFGDDAPAHGLDRPRVAHLLHPELGHDVGRHALRACDLDVHLLGLLAADGARVDERQELRELPRRDRDGRGQAVRGDVAQDLALNEVRDARRLPVQGRRLLEEGRDARVPREHVRRVRCEAHLGDEALALGARELGHRRANALDVRVVEYQRRQIGIREVAVVLRLLLAAQAEGRPGVLLPAARLLHDAAAAVEHRGLARDLVGDGLLDEAERVDVLELDARAELRLARGADAHVGVAAEAPLFEVAVVDADEDEDVAQRAQVLRRLGRRAQVGLADDLDEGHAGAVQVDDARVRVVDVLARVLLHVHARDADTPRRAAHLDVEVPLVAERLVVLADLVALRQVRVEVVLAGEAARRGDGAREGQRGAHRHRDGVRVEHGQRARQPQAHRAHLRVGRRAVVGGAAAEGLAAREQLRVHLQPDDGLVRHCTECLGDYSAHVTSKATRQSEQPKRSPSGSTSRATARGSRTPAPSSTRSVKCIAIAPQLCTAKTGTPVRTPRTLAAPVARASRPPNSLYQADTCGSHAATVSADTVFSATPL